MNKKVLKTLEYYKIIGRVARYGVSKEASKRINALKPLRQIGEIRLALNETNSALDRLKRAGEPSFRGIVSVESACQRLKVKATLDMEELLGIASVLETAYNLSEYGTSSAPEGKNDNITPYLQELVSVPSLSGEIKRCILSADEMADDASAALALIRKKLGEMDARVHDELNAILNRGENRNYLSGTNITMRDGRYCLPVRSENKKHFPGMVCGQSGTGSTLFIEPESVIKLNNEYQMLLLDEKKEIEKILQRLSDIAAEYADDIKRDEEVLIKLDVIFAKAKYARDIKAKVPVISDDRKIKLIAARHPLIPMDQVKPVDISLGEEYDMLIVTGPNTGGKTVSLKTTGLLTLMAMSGLLIPAESGSRIAVFDEIYADIGDEQSIEQSLSTFSSHMKNITWIIDHANEKTFVLLDELCSGTDPTEGAALAEAILDHFREKKIIAMATTHYAELKLYAMSTDRVENASLEFDVESLSPTYRLLVGIPGKSNAFAISEKLGLKKSVIESAKGHISSDHANFEDLLADLEKSRVIIEKEREEIARLKDESRELELKLKTREEKLNSSKDKILREAKEEAMDILKDAKSLADETIRDFRKLSDSGNADMKKMEAKRTRIREAITQNSNSPEERKEVSTGKLDPDRIKEKDRVYVISLGMDADVVIPPKNGKLTVQAGILKSQVSVDDIAPPKVKSEKKDRSDQQVVYYDRSAVNRAMYMSPEIMLLGKTVDEALPELDRYLSDAYLSHLESVRVVHGKGTGALRDAIHRFLKKQSYVKKYHLGEYGEGDAGVTIVEFN